MLSALLDRLFGCGHRNYSFPMTIRSGRRSATLPRPVGTYVVCLECGKELSYDWSKMRVSAVAPASWQSSFQEVEAG
jgi:hypothetical protein